MKNRRIQLAVFLMSPILLAIGGLVIWVRLSDPLVDLPVPEQKHEESSTQPTIKTASRIDDSLYTGSASCRECHQEIYDSYVKTPMANSISADVLGARFTGSSGQRTTTIGKQAGQAGQLQYKVSFQNDQQLHSERMLNSDEKTIYKITNQIDWIIGSGERGCTFLVEDRGNLYQSPITWYAEEDRWDLSPGYEKDNESFNRRIGDACLSCHAGRLNHSDQGEDHYNADPFKEMRIGCERCHGPGKEHISFHNDDLTSVEDPIVNPANLDFELREDICLQCHVSANLRVQQPDHTFLDFIPGEQLAETFVPFEEGAGIEAGNETQAVQHVGQLQASECYIQSQGKLGCTSCHDPHRNVPEDSFVEFYRRRCMQCHQIDNQPTCALPETTRRQRVSSDSCIECHMPKRTTSNVAHTSQTDHRIVRFQLDADSDHAEKMKMLQPVIDVSSLTDEELERARIIARVPSLLTKEDHFQSNQALKTLENIVSLNSNDSEGMRAIALLHQFLGHPREEEIYLKRLLEIKPNSEFELERIVRLYHTQERYQEGLIYAERLLELNPRHPDIWGRKAHILGNLGRYQEGISAAQNSLKYAPASAQVHEWLSIAYRLVNEPHKASYHEMHAKKLSVEDR